MKRFVPIPLSVVVALAATTTAAQATDRYRLSFDYKPAPAYRDSVADMLGLSAAQAPQIKGILSIQVDGELFYSKIEIEGSVRLQEWRYPNRVVRYNTTLNDLQVEKPERMTRDIIPIWLPTKYLSRRFLRESTECDAGEGVCVEYPGRLDRTLRLPMKSNGPTRSLSLPGREHEFLIQWMMTGKRLDRVEVLDSFKTLTPGTTDLAVVQHSQLTLIGQPALADKEIDPWESYAKKARSITIDGVGIRYDPKKGSLWDQRLASIQAWKDADMAKKRSDGVGMGNLVRTTLALGLLIVLAGTIKILIKLIRRA